jgi:uncharacterized protein YcbK (DUF882 family)
MTAPFSSRRRHVVGALLGAWGAPSLVSASAPATRRERWLELASTHTGESLAVAYRNAEGFVTGALANLQHLLRDHRSGAQHPIDARLYDLLADLADAAQVEPRYEIISGYRSPASNAQLHDRSDGVAVKSLHLEGRAIDVRLRGVRTARLGELARAAERGGVGTYAKSAFVHVDTGRVRAWYG